MVRENEQRKGVDYDEVHMYAPVAKYETMRGFLASCVEKEMHVHQVITAYAQGKVEEKYTGCPRNAGVLETGDSWSDLKHFFLSENVLCGFVNEILRKNPDQSKRDSAGRAAAVAWLRTALLRTN